MKSSFSMSGGTLKDCSAAAEPLGDAAADGAVDSAADGSALVPPPPVLHAARNAALADIALAHKKPRRLSGTR